MSYEIVLSEEQIARLSTGAEIKAKINKTESVLIRGAVMKNVVMPVRVDVSNMMDAIGGANIANSQIKIGIDVGAGFGSGLLDINEELEKASKKIAERSLFGWI